MVTLTESKFIRPLFNYLICEPIVEKVTAGGIMLTDGTAAVGLSNLKKARVLRAGPGKRHEHTGEFIKTEIQPGQIVYPMGSVLAFQEGGRDLMLIPEEMVCGVEELDSHMEE